MELYLNALWLLLAVAVVGCCVGYQIALKGSPRDLVRALLAVGILCVFLFPVISATDDLHPVQAVIEESSRRAISGIHGVSYQPLAIHSTTLTLLQLFLVMVPALVFLGRILEFSKPKHLSVFVARQDGRAPPVVAR
jgi:hypothetical protein